MTFYRRDQFHKVGKIVETTGGPADWLLLAGPADGNEAQCAVEMWPEVRVLAVEPNAAACSFQRANGFPSECDGHWLWNGALMDYTGSCIVTGAGPDDLRHARTEPTTDLFGKGALVCWTLDYLDALCGPFERALLWLDVEGSEARALKGAKGLLHRGAVLWVTVETCAREPEATKEVEGILEGHGFFRVQVWNTSGDYKDTLWRLR